MAHQKQQKNGDNICAAVDISAICCKSVITIFLFLLLLMCHSLRR